MLVVVNNVKALREKANLSMYELSKRCGFISRGRVVNTQIKKLEEMGTYPRLDTAYAIFHELKKAGVCNDFQEVFSYFEKSDIEIEEK